MRFVSRTVANDGDNFEMFYEIQGDNLVLKDVIPENKGKSLPKEVEEANHKETIDLMTTYSTLDQDQDSYYVSHLATKGIVIIVDEDE